MISCRNCTNVHPQMHRAMLEALPHFEGRSLILVPNYSATVKSLILKHFVYTFSNLAQKCSSGGANRGFFISNISFMCHHWTVIQELYDHWYLELTKHEVIHPVPIYQAFEVCWGMCDVTRTDPLKLSSCLHGSQFALSTPSCSWLQVSHIST